jgi:hypothetical protein
MFLMNLIVLLLYQAEVMLTPGAKMSPQANGDLLLRGRGKANRARQSEYIALNRLGIIHLLRGQWEEALAACSAYFALTRDLGDRLGTGHSYLHLGRIHRCWGSLEEAICLAINTWRAALTKLHTDSPEHREVSEWLAHAIDFGNRHSFPENACFQTEK